MRVSYIGEKDYKLLVEYNKILYPEREEQWISNRFLKNPLFNKGKAEMFSVAFSDENTILGQSLALPMQFFWNGNLNFGYWGEDWFVTPKYRTAGPIGNALARILPSNTFSCAHTEIALKIRLILKDKNLGDLRRLIKIVSWRKLFIDSFFGSTNKWIDNVDYPSNLSKNFLRIANEKEIFSVESAWNDEVIEFDRSTSFLKWRFFHSTIYNYGFYVKRDENKISYFVVRPLIWKKVRTLLVSDYRCNLTNSGEMMDILDALKFLAKKIGATWILLGSSLSAVDNATSYKGYRTITQGPILAKTKIELPQDKINNRNAIFVTFADFDADFNYGQKNNVLNESKLIITILRKIILILINKIKNIK
tara:strand:+ start:3681 stop:4772 length:1092 start_codon:yes stop_codon:yes gene_type:complete